MRIIITITVILFSLNVKAQLMPTEMVEVYDHLSMMPYSEKFEKLDSLQLDQPNQPWYFWMAAEIYSMKGDDSLTILNYEKSIEIDPDFAAGYASYSRFLRNANPTNLDLALQHINHAIELDPDPMWFIDRGEIYREQNKYELAIEEANAALRSGEVDPMPAVQLLVHSIFDSGNKARLKEYLLTYDLTSFGGFMDTKFDLLIGSLYLEYGDSEKACKCFNSAAMPYTFMDEEIPPYVQVELDKCK